MGKKLFDDDADGEAIVSDEIGIDENFAKKFEYNNRRADLHRLKELQKQGLVADSGSESAESESESEESSEDMEEFIDKLIQVRNRDPSIYNDKTAKLFQSSDDALENEGSEDEPSSKSLNSKKRRKKPAYLKDVVAQQLLDDSENAFEGRVDKDNRTYLQEQEELRNAFMEAAGEAEYDGDLIKEKTDSTREAPSSDGDRELDQKLAEYFGQDNELSENDRFLKDYFRHKMWIDKNDSQDVDEEEVHAAILDEYEVEKQEKYEEALCYRHEENAGDRVLGHSRVVDGSVRKKTNSRKDQRQRREERIKVAEKQKREELKHLKNLKKEEMMERIKKVMDAAGIKNSSHCALDVDDLDNDFNPDEYDKMMNKAFDDRYYDAEDVDPDFGSDQDATDFGKPDFDKEDELLGLPKGWDCGSGDGFYAARERILDKATKESDPIPAGEEHENGENEGESSKNKKRNISVLQKATEEMLEEYYKLDYEDTIGDLKTRFRYAKVKPNRYGLKAVDILTVEEKELNQYVSTKKLAPYRENEWKVPDARRHQFKLKLKELRRGAIDDQQRRIKAKTKQPKRKQEDGEAIEQSPRGDVNAETSMSRQAKRRRRRQAELKLSQSRRLAYGQAQSKPRH